MGSLAIAAHAATQGRLGFALSSNAECPHGGTATARSIPAAGIHPRFSVSFYLTNACVLRHQFLRTAPSRRF